MKIYSCIALSAFSLVAVAGLASCASDLEQTAQSRKVPMSVLLTKGGENTRATLADNGGDLMCSWEPDDRLLVACDGMPLGVLEFRPEDDATVTGPVTSARFAGELSVDFTGEREFAFFYLGKNIDPDTVAGTVTISFAEQDGSLASLSSSDFFTAKSRVTVTDDRVITPSVEMRRHTAFSLFNLALPEGVEYGGEPVTVTGSNLLTEASVSLTGEVSFTQPAQRSGSAISTTAGKTGDLWLTILPGEMTDLVFETRIDGVTYVSHLPERQWAAGEFVREYDEKTGAAGGVAVVLAEEIPEPVEDTVGPVFEISADNESYRFRFTRANLAFDTEMRRWRMLDEQWSTAGRRGWADADGNSLAQQQESLIDLFGFGSTGLTWDYTNAVTGKHFSERTNAPDYFARTVASGYDPAGESMRYPTQNSDCNEGVFSSAAGSPSNFPLTGTGADWGTAYGLQQGTGKYYTLSLAAWDALIGKYVTSGVKIRKQEGANDFICGYIIFDCTSKEQAKALLGNSAEYMATNFGELKLNGVNKFSYNMLLISLDQFKALEAAGHVVFLPETGFSEVTPGVCTSGEGDYWTSTIVRGGRSATALRFAGGSDGLFEAYSYPRVRGCAVRLVMEVKE